MIISHPNSSERFSKFFLPVSVQSIFPEVNKIGFISNFSLRIYIWKWESFPPETAMAQSYPSPFEPLYLSHNCSNSVQRSFQSIFFCFS